MLRLSETENKARGSKAAPYFGEITAAKIKASGIETFPIFRCPAIKANGEPCKRWENSLINWTRDSNGKPTGLMQFASDDGLCSQHAGETAQH